MELLKVVGNVVRDW